ncbi:MAG: ABC transporter substrate-binding protein [Actinobacteria bacterium]|nr:ABC transporter substrate-binding protein [Actinomycetota bacterium]
MTPLGARDLRAAGEVTGASIEVGNGSSIEFVGLPSGEGSPWANRAVRIAFSQALDREELVRRVFRGSRAPATGFLPPSLGADFHRERACGRATPVRGDVERARATLDAAGVDLRAQRLPFYVNDDFANVALADEVARQWNAAFGPVFEVVALPWQEFLRAGEQASGFDGPFRVSWSSPYPSVDAYLFPLFHTSAIGIGNLSRYSDVDFDRAIERNARRAEDPEDLRLEYLALEDHVCRDLPLIPLTFDLAHYLVRGDVASAADVVLDPATGEPLLREFYLN